MNRSAGNHDLGHDLAHDPGHEGETNAGSAHVAVGAATFAVLLAACALLWARFGEDVYIERILGAIASCF